MKIITIIIVFCLAIVTASSVAMNEFHDTHANPFWLSHFVGDEVIVTFISAPPGMSRTVRALLMDAEHPGIVLKISVKEIFFSYDNIISVEPALQSP